MNSDNVIFAGFLAVALLAGVIFYFSGPAGTESVKSQIQVTSSTSPEAATSTSSTVTITTTTTVLEPVPSSSTTTATTSSTTLSSSTTTTSTTLVEVRAPSYLARYAGKGYRQAYMHIVFYCPSCVPAMANSIQYEPGVMGKSISYRQDISWVIYDPDTVSLDRILELAGSSGGATLINVTDI